MYSRFLSEYAIDLYQECIIYVKKFKLIIQKDYLVLFFL